MLDSFSNIINLALDPILSPLLALPAAWSIIIITFIITLMITLIHKHFSDQEKLKNIRERMKAIQKEMRESKNDTQKVLKLQKESMGIAGEQMRLQFKPMLITFIPIIVIFAWFSSHLSYLPITPGETFTTTVSFSKESPGNVSINLPEGIVHADGDPEPKMLEKESGWIFKNKFETARWDLSGGKGEYLLTYDIGEKSYSKDLIITNEKAYKTPEKPINDGVVSSISVDNEPIRVLGLSWFWAYFIFAMVFSIALRKIMKVH